MQHKSNGNINSNTKDNAKNKTIQDYSSNSNAKKIPHNLLDDGRERRDGPGGD